MSRKLRSGLVREDGDQRAKPKGWGMWGSNPKLPELGWWPLRHLRPGRGVWSCGQKHDSAAPEAHRGAVPAQSHRCHRCAREQASPWPSNLLSAFLRSLSVLSGGPAPHGAPSSPRGVPAQQGGGAGGFISQQGKAKAAPAPPPSTALGPALWPAHPPGQVLPPQGPGPSPRGGLFCRRPVDESPASEPGRPRAA